MFHFGSLVIVFSFSRTSLSSVCSDPYCGKGVLTGPCDAAWSDVAVNTTFFGALTMIFLTLRQKIEDGIGYRS
jgi:hypothetical protein